MLASLWQNLCYVLRVHKMPLLALLAGLVLPWVVFVNVAEDIWESGGFIGDKRILEFLHAHATPAHSTATRKHVAAFKLSEERRLVGHPSMLTASPSPWSSSAIPPCGRTRRSVGRPCSAG